MSWTYPAAALAAYLIGAIPFGYLIYYALTKQDVRKVGSGNIGATNVGRLLGFRFFALVFLLDMLKGLLPAVGLPWLFARLGWDPPADLPVVAALGAIVGHNFPVYLGFKGGKGVATSLGALLALQPLACGVAAVAFFAVFLPSHYVSLSSMTGGLAFAATYFLRSEAPWDREHLAMSLLVTAVVVLLIGRHRKNIGRLLAGTENRIEFGRKRRDVPPGPSGMVRPGVLIGIAAAVLIAGGVGAWVARTANAPVEAVAGPWMLKETHREATGQQRAERVAFDAAGDHLAVLCPRYNRVLTYRVGRDAKLALAATIGVAGRPVAIAILGANVAVLQRPVNDAKHLGPGWIDVYSLDGEPEGERVEVGYYPDDLAATPDGSHLAVLTSGRAEGDPDKPAPELTVYATADLVGDAVARPVGRLAFEDGDDLERLTLSNLGLGGLATLARSREAVAFDLTDPATPRPAAGRMDLSHADAPYISQGGYGDWVLLPGKGEAVAVATLPDGREAEVAKYLVAAPEGSSYLHLVQVDPPALLGEFPVLGPLNLSGAEPAALAYCAPRRLIAVATKPGAVHVVRLVSRLAPGGTDAGR